jgi:hypothetical protein
MNTGTPCLIGYFYVTDVVRVAEIDLNGDSLLSVTRLFGVLNLISAGFCGNFRTMLLILKSVLLTISWSIIITKQFNRLTTNFCFLFHFTAHCHYACRMRGVMWIMNWKWSGRKKLCPILRCYPSISWRQTVQTLPRLIEDMKQGPTEC